MSKKRYFLWIITTIIVIILLLSFLVIVFIFRRATIPAQSNHSATVIFLHGLGDGAKNWKKRFELIRERFPEVKFIFPQAPITSINFNRWWLMIPAWYSIKGNPKDVFSLQEDKFSLINSVKRIEKIIRQEVENDIPVQRIIVSGFSQGAATALAVGLTSDYQLRGIIGLSGFLPCRNEIFDLAKEENKQIPFFLFHNRHDGVVPQWVGFESAELLKEKGYKIEFKGDYNGRHFFRPKKLQEIVTKKLNELLFK